ncbi:MAG: four helix bundle protein [Acidimicrobiia bacterium]
MRSLNRSAVLRQARALNPIVYDLTRRLPEAERFGLVSQLRRASVSVTANIAEGLGRGSPGDFARFLRIASGSAAEVEALLFVAIDLGHLSKEEVGPATRRVHHLRWSLRKLIAQVKAD